MLSASDGGRLPLFLEGHIILRKQVNEASLNNFSEKNPVFEKAGSEFGSKTSI